MPAPDGDELNVPAEPSEYRAQLIEKAMSGSTAAVARLVEDLQRLDEDPVVLDVVNAFVSGARAQDLLDLARRIRLFSSWGSSGWHGLKPADLPAFETLWPNPRTGLVICSMSRNGYLREVAVHSLSSDPAGPSLGALLIRTADWVVQVRHPAATAVEQVLDTTPERLIEWLPMLDRSSTIRGSEAGTRIEKTVRDLRFATALLDNLNHTDVQVRQACGRRLPTGDLPTQLYAAALTRAMTQSDPATAGIVVLPMLDDHRVTSEQLRVAATSRHATVRSRAVWVGQTDIGFADVIQTALHDLSAPVRETAQLAMHNKGEDPADVYRLALRDRSAGLAVVAGIGECGRPDDAVLLAPYLSSASARMRAAAVTGVGRLDLRAFRGELTAALGDESPRVARAAAQALRPSVGQLDRERLWEILGKAPEVSARWVFWLLTQPNRFVELASSLRVLAEGPHHLDERAIDRVRVILAAWPSVSRHRPDKPTIEHIVRLLPEVRPRLGDGLSDQLDEVLKPWKRGLA